MDKFPKILKYLREEKELTQVELAQKLGYKTHNTIGLWENGRRVPDIENFILIANFFDVTIDYLVGREKM